MCIRDRGLECSAGPLMAFRQRVHSAGNAAGFCPERDSLPEAIRRVQSGTARRLSLIDIIVGVKYNLTTIYLKANHGTYPDPIRQQRWADHPAPLVRALGVYCRATGRSQ